MVWAGKAIGLSLGGFRVGSRAYLVGFTTIGLRPPPPPPPKKKKENDKNKKEENIVVLRVT